MPNTQKKTSWKAPVNRDRSCVFRINEDIPKNDDTKSGMRENGTCW